MSEEKQTGPVMDGATEATNHEKLQGLTEQVQSDHGPEGEAAVAAHLEDRMEETGVHAEDDSNDEEKR